MSDETSRIVAVTQEDRDLADWFIRRMEGFSGFEEHVSRLLARHREQATAFLLDMELPCDVTVHPATTFRAGVKLSTLLGCIEDRRALLKDHNA